MALGFLSLNGSKIWDERVLLLLDNCPSYKLEGLNLQHIEICFLPSNITSKIQPIDAGIIMSFKKKYHYFYIRYVNLFY